MRYWTKLIVMTSALLAVSLPALADNHGADSTPCESDADCGEYQVCVEGHGDDDGAVDVISNEPDAAEDMARLESCEADEDCGDGWLCEDGYCAYDRSEEPAGPDEPEVDEVDEVEGGDETSKYCAVDLSALPADPACASLCEIMSACGGLGEGSSDVSGDSNDGEASSSGFTPEEGEGSGDEDGAEGMPEADVPVQSCETDDDCAEEDAECVDGQCSTSWEHSEMEPGDSEAIEMSPEDMEQAMMMCNQICNYGAYLEAGVDELASLNACLETADSETLCIDEPCAAEGEAWVEALESGGILEGLESSVGGVNMGAAESGPPTDDGMEMSAGDSNASGEGDEGASVGGGDEEAVGGGDEEAEDAGGCNASDAPVVPWIALMMLMTVALMRRRERA
jgi:uncharacterized protein (TIGR03382 family)